MEDEVKEKFVNALFYSVSTLIAEQKYDIREVKVQRAQKLIAELKVVLMELDSNIKATYFNRFKDRFEDLQKYLGSLQLEVANPRGGPKLHDEMACLIYFLCEPHKNDLSKMNEVKELIRQHGELHTLYSKYKNDLLYSGHECEIPFEYIKIPACSANEWYLNGRKSIKNAATRYLKKIGRTDKEIKIDLKELKLEEIPTQYEILKSFSQNGIRSYYADIMKLEAGVSLEEVFSS